MKLIYDGPSSTWRPMKRSSTKQMQVQIRPHRREPAWPESVSAQSCRTNNRPSFFNSGCGVIQADDHSAKTFLGVQIVGKLLCCLLAGNFSGAYPVKRAVFNRHLLNRRRRIQLIQTRAQPLGISLFLESSNLHGK